MDTTKPSSVSPFSATSGIDPAYASPYSCMPAELAAQLSTALPPLLIDVRRNDPFVNADATLPGALRRDPAKLAEWATQLPPGRAVQVYCVYGHNVGFDTMTALRERGVDAQFLQGGIAEWRAQGLPLTPKPVGSATRWVTRERPKIDRIACPWLIRRFVDAQADFLYVPASEVRATALAQQATPYDVNANVADTPFTHVGELCSFDAFVRLYHLQADTALARLADIVRGADTDRLHLAPQAAGLLALSLGMSRLISDDHKMLEALLPVYDALYAWCRDAALGTDERHNWVVA